MDTTRKLNSIDFMMMDVHRELDKENCDPETMLDKSARPQQEEHGDEEGVGVSHEETSARCEFCFGPMPCYDHPNIETLNVVTRLDISPLTVIAGAAGAQLKEVVIVGVKEDGEEYFASSVSDGADSAWHLQRGIYKLNKIMDGEYENENLGPPPGASA
jgi:hypothetical protein